MKNIILILLICFSSLYAEIDEYKSDVYFANGIDTDEQESYKYIEKIQKYSKSKFPKNFNSIKKWDIVYNHTYGIGIDLYESLLQKIYEDEPGKSIVPFVWNIGEISDYLVLSFKGVLKRVIKKVSKISIKNYASKVAKVLARRIVLIYNKRYGKKFTQEQIELMFDGVFDYLIEKATKSYVTKTEEEILEDELADVITHYRAYEKSITNGHGVIVVAHSQGNLFLNRAYSFFKKHLLGKDNSWMRKYIHAIGIASPANNILGKKEPHMTFDNDMIQIVPDSLPINITNPTRYYFKIATGEVIESVLSAKAHAFLTSYMATDITRDAILGFIDDSIQEHIKAKSQWKLKKQPKCSITDCKDKLTEVEHKYDSSLNALMKGKLVYSFKEDGKLYKVKDDYVKADYGGKKIVEPISEDVCYALKDEDNKTIGTIDSNFKEFSKSPQKWYHRGYFSMG